jgi:hypothetical protein
MVARSGNSSNLLASAISSYFFMCQSALMMHPQKIDFAKSVLAENYKGIIKGRKGKKGPPTSRDTLPSAHESVKSV